MIWPLVRQLATFVLLLHFSNHASASPTLSAAVLDEEIDFDDLSQWINPDLDLEQLAAQFAADDMVVIKNILRPSHADLLAQFFAEQLSEVNWVSSQSVEDAKSVDLIRTLKNKEEMARNKEKAQEVRGKGKFAFSFDRTHSAQVSHSPDCPCWLCFLEREFFTSPQYKQLLYRITGQDYLLKTMFASRYQEGDFLTQHTDHLGNRALAYVLHLSKDWKPEYGGLFLMLNAKDRMQVDKTFVPQFNTLLLFNVTAHNHPHVVTDVARGVKHARISVAGWMKVDTKDGAQDELFTHTPAENQHAHKRQQQELQSKQDL